MLLKSLLSIALLTSATSAMAEEAKPAEKKLVSVSYHGEYYITRSNTENLSDLKIMHNPTIGFNLPMDMKLSATAEFNYSKSGAGKFPNSFYRGLLSFSKSNLLTEKEYGFQLDAGLARRYFDSRVQNNLTGTYGNTRINTTITKNFGENNASLFAQILLNDIKQKDPSQWKTGLELIPTINIQLTKDLTYTFTDDINFNTADTSGSVNSVTMSHEASFAVLT